MAFYNTRVENTLSTLLDDGDSSIMCNFYLGAHRRNHHLTLTYTRGQLQSKITILGKDLTPVQRTMVLNRQDLFAGQQKHFVISDRLLMVRYVQVWLICFFFGGFICVPVCVLWIVQGKFHA